MTARLPVVPPIAALQVCVRAAVAAALAVAVSTRLGLAVPLYAMIAAVIVCDLSARETRRLGGPRVIGTIIGAAVGAALSTVLGAGPFSIGVGVGMTMVVAHFTGLAAAARLAGYVCGIVLLEHRDHPWIYAGERLLETLVGVGMAVLVSMVPKVLGDGADRHAPAAERARTAEPPAGLEVPSAGS
jgi:uncharacterized membrane protein YgaE (UPF0421/DUF939 family)